MSEVLKPLEGKRLHVAFRRYVRMHTVVSDFDPEKHKWVESKDSEPEMAPPIYGDMISMRVLAADGYLRKVGTDGSLLFDVRTAYYHPEDVKIMAQVPDGGYIQKGALLGESRDQLLFTMNDEVLSMSIGQGEDQTYHSEEDFKEEPSRVGS